MNQRVLNPLRQVFDVLASNRELNSNHSSDDCTQTEGIRFRRSAKIQNNRRYDTKTCQGKTNPGKNIVSREYHPSCNKDGVRCVNTSGLS